VNIDSTRDESDEDYRRRLRRESQRLRRNKQNLHEQEFARETNITGHKRLRQAASNDTERWWDRVAKLNATNIPYVSTLKWNRTCKYCGIKVREILRPRSSLNSIRP
jgi:biotin synthase-like enzyme